MVLLWLLLSVGGAVVLLMMCKLCVVGCVWVLLRVVAVCGCVVCGCCCAGPVCGWCERDCVLSWCGYVCLLLCVLVGACGW